MRSANHHEVNGFEADHQLLIGGESNIYVDINTGDIHFIGSNTFDPNCLGFNCSRTTVSSQVRVCGSDDDDITMMASSSS